MGLGSVPNGRTINAQHRSPDVPVRTSGAVSAAAAFMAIAPANAARTMPSTRSRWNWSPSPTAEVPGASCWSSSSPAPGRSPAARTIIRCSKTASRLAGSSIFENWVDQAAIEAHMTTPAIKAAGPKLEPILAKPFAQEFLKMISDG